MLPLIISMPGPVELAIIFAVIMLLFGAKRLPKLARSLGETIKETKRIGKELEDIDESK